MSAIEVYPEGCELPQGVAVCGTCGRAWDDDAVTDVTPVPSGRCPFEYEHGEVASFWIVIEAEHPERYEHVVLGPFESREDATHHLLYSAQVDGYCEDDAIDCAVLNDAGKDREVARWDQAGEPWGTYAPCTEDEGQS